MKEMMMEMHTRESLRRIHGIEARSVIVNAHTDRFNCADHTTMAVQMRDQYVGNALADGVTKLVEWVSKLTTSIKDEHRYRKAQQALSEMSDHQLKDIGIERGRIVHAVRHGRTHDGLV